MRMPASLMVAGSPIPVALPLLLFLVASFPGSLRAQASDPGIQWVNMEVSRVLSFYEMWTGNRVIMDSEVQGATITIITNEPMPDPEKAVFVEKSLLLNGFALVPAGGKTVKAILVPGVSGQARSEGLEVFAEPADLPDTDRIVAYVMRFDHLGAENAATALSSVFPSHGYGSIVPFPQASSVVITDSTAVIRRYLELKPHIDVPREDVPLSIREFTLERADAQEVVDALAELLSFQSGTSGQRRPPQGGGGNGRGGPENLVAGRGNAGGSVNLATGGSTFARVSALGRDSAQTLLQSPSPDKAKVEPKVRADPRTNKVLAVAEPKDMDYIETLIKFLDSPAPERTLYTRQLHYLPVSTLLSNLPNALLPGVETRGGAGGGNVSGGEEPAGRESSRGAGGQPLAGATGTEGGATGTAGTLSGFDFGTDAGPQSIVVDKTFIMADNIHNRILATGPIEHLEIIDALIEELDRKPRQIQISTVIAQLTLGDNLDVGLDLLQQVNDATEPNDVAGALRSRPLLDLESLLNVSNFSPLGQGLTLYGKIDDHLNTYLSALEATNRFKVLARPTVYTRNDKLAVISTGQRIAVPSTSVSTVDPGNVNQAVTSSISFEDVLLQIEVLPLINSDDEVTLNIVQVNDDIVGSQTIGGNSIPTIGTQQIATTVVVPDGGTVLLGGLITEDDRSDRNGIPRFVGIPLVGQLFGTTSNETTRQELLVFIQPKIVTSPVDLATAQADMQARSDLTRDALEFAAPPIRAESEPVRKPSLFDRIFERKSDQSQPNPTRTSTQPAPILNRNRAPE